MADGFLQVLGLLRWSYPSDPSAFNKGAETLEELRAELYDDARLEERLFYLEHVILPCLAAQSDAKFKVVMLMGENLPDPWKERVLNAISTVPQVVPVFEHEGQKHRLVCRAAMMEHRNPRANAVAEFRLDDDDAICRDFVELVRRTYRRHKTIADGKGRFAIDFTQGLILDTRTDAAQLHPVLAQFWVPALALIYPPDHIRSLIDYPHKAVWKAMPSLELPGHVAFIRGVHGGNDSSIGETHFAPHSWDFDPAGAEKVLLDRFGLDWPVLVKAWADVKSKAAA
ncbi:MAG: putative rhamnosyl transferase [Rhodobacteraceae bacterium]|nr:putative rhamnosyl transferase [Paracoccaceae bacterium]